MEERMSENVREEKVESFGGVELKARGGETKEGKQRIITREDEYLLQKLAVCIQLNQPVLVEGESGLGKTEMIDYISELLEWDMSYLNCHDMEPDQIMGAKTLDNTTISGFGFKEGRLPEGVREGNLTVFDEINFIRGENRAVIAESLDAILRQKDYIINSFNDGEKVPIHEDFRLIALQNPPGGAYGNREILDPPQLTRFVHVRLNPMSKRHKLARLKGSFGQKHTKMPKKDYIQVNGDIMQYTDQATLQDFIERYVGFSIEFDELVQTRQLGSNYEQPIYTSFQREWDRIKTFMFKFPQQDIKASFIRAVSFYYECKVIGNKDMNLLDGLITKHFDGEMVKSQDEQEGE